MEVYRLSKQKYAATLSGVGAAKEGARWNSKGTEIIYTASNRSLAMAEVMVHSLPNVPRDYVMLTIFVPDRLSLRHLHETELPMDWNIFPHPSATKLLGYEFIHENIYCLLKVPSATTKGDHNLLINPFHPEFKEIKIVAVEPFPFDNRLFRIDPSPPMVDPLDLQQQPSSRLPKKSQKRQTKSKP